MASQSLNDLARLQSPLLARLARIHSILADSPDFYAHLDRLNELDGHTGCVNALSWSADGEILLSGGDDRTVRLWRLDEASEDAASFPFTTRATVRTGHSSNIFNAHFLSSDSSVFATCARDSHVRIFDTNRISNGDPHLRRATYKGIWDDVVTTTACLRVLRCHTDAVKRIATEESDSHFLTVSEDGTVRQHDLRVPHVCDRRKECSPPLLKVDHRLLTLSMSPLAPYYFVVAGESPHGYLYDRRNCGRSLFNEWGAHHRKGHLITCVRTFGRRRRGPSEPGIEAHITGSKLSHCHPHELLLNYSGDAVYLYNIRDDPGVNAQEESLPELEPTQLEAAPSANSESPDISEPETELEPDWGEPFVKPRMRYAGACNVETVKDVNFLGHCDEYVACGSDDGNYFIWSKRTGEVVNVLEGDGSVVNVIEQNPILQCIAVSGIDTTVKIFGRGRRESRFSKLGSLAEILDENGRRPGNLYQVQRANLLALIAHYRITGPEGEESECVHQ